MSIRFSCDFEAFASKSQENLIDISFFSQEYITKVYHILRFVILADIKTTEDCYHQQEIYMFLSSIDFR